MIGSLFAGISGLNVNSKTMTVIGDNIANVNTTAFKSNRASFANILSQSLGGDGSSDIGRGVEFTTTTPAWNQGSIENTSNATDMAINGGGFFVLRDNAGSNFYTRAGEFSFDRDGNLVNVDNFFVQGYEVTAVDPVGNLTLGSVLDINVPGQSTSPPMATDEFTVDVNLDASASISSTYATSITVYDSLGNSIPLTITFTKIAAGQWDAAISVPPGTLGGGGSVAINNNSFTFTGVGDLQNGSDPMITISGLASGADNMNITWDVFDDITNTTNGDLTHYASASTTIFQTANGYTSGMLRGVAIDEYGVLTGSYSNGQLVPLYKVVLADFPSYYGLTKMGQNLYSESRASGQAMLGTPQSGRLGSISSNALEMANVDLAQEFVKMITTQRAFQANSRVITASDEILNELINLKR